MKKILSSLLVMMLLLTMFPLSAISVSAAQDGYYTYTINNNTATITAVSTFISGDVVIPSELGGCPVKVISSYAFRNCNYISSVVVPEGVTVIDSGAFDSSSLKTIELPSTLATIGSYAFKSSGLESIIIPDGVTRIEASTFAYCKSIEFVSLPRSVNFIGSHAFSEAKVKNLTLPKAVGTIGYAAFWNTSLYDVWYTGAEAESKAIDFGIGNDNLQSATWHFNTCENAQHTYANACATECSACEWVRETPNAHTYNSIYDPDCNVCGEMRIVSGTRRLPVDIRWHSSDYIG